MPPNYPIELRHFGTRNRNKAIHLSSRSDNIAKQCKIVVLHIPDAPIDPVGAHESRGIWSQHSEQLAHGHIDLAEPRGPVSPARVTGIRLWIGAHSSFGSVFSTEKVCTLSPSA